MGEAIARRAVAEGARATIAGRDPERRIAAQGRLGAGVRGVGVARRKIVSGWGAQKKAKEGPGAAPKTLPVRGRAHPADIARAALFLMTAVYTTGVVVTCDGGGYLL